MNSGAVQLVEYFRRIDFLAESTFVLLTLSFVDFLAPGRHQSLRVGLTLGKKEGCKPQPAPLEGSLFNVFEVVGEHNQVCVKLRHDHDTGVKRRSFHRLPIEPIASTSEVLQIRTARS